VAAREPALDGNDAGQPLQGVLADVVSGDREHRGAILRLGAPDGASDQREGDGGDQGLHAASMAPARSGYALDFSVEKR